MATLTSETIASTYTLLLKMASGGVASGLVKVQDGDATDSALSIGTVSIAIDATDKFYLDGGTHTYIDESAADIMDFYSGGTHMLSLDKTNTEVVVNEGSADINFRVEGNGDINLLFCDAGNDRVGIGTAAPGENLHVLHSSGSAASTILIENTVNGENSYLEVKAKTSGGDSHSAKLTLDGASEDFHIDMEDTANAFVITQEGDVGIGQTSPEARLHVEDDNDDRVVALFENTHSTGYGIAIKMGAAQPTTSDFHIQFIDSAGNVEDTMRGDGSDGVQFTGSADDAYSDKRVKTDIADLTGALARINSVKARTYKYTDEFLDQSFQGHKIKDWQKKTQIGFVAQELGEVFPDILQPAVHIVQSDGVSYDGETYNTGDEVEIIQTCWGRRGTLIMFANLIQAVQELSAKVTALENA
tara:strand:- start:266 stop:1513 length:1248 start_codon:yes stop_codon:yes gene_type:complete